MSASTGAQGSSQRALRAMPFALLALLGLLGIGLAGSAGGPRPDPVVLPRHGNSGHALAGTGGRVDGGPQAVASGSFKITGKLTGLYPGLTKALALTVTNPQSFAIVVTSIVTKVQNASATCTAPNLAVSAFSGQLSVPALGSAKTSVLAKLAQGAPNPCIGATFPLVYSGVGKKA
jgi:hypothetical protein